MALVVTAGSMLLVGIALVVAAEVRVVLEEAVAGLVGVVSVVWPDAVVNKTQSISGHLFNLYSQ